MTERSGLREIVMQLAEGQDLPAEDRAAVERIVGEIESQQPPQPLALEPSPEMAAASVSPAATGAPKADESSEDIRVQIGKMSVPEKVKVALLGNSTCRQLLIRDPNRMVQLIVLQNPRMTPGEIEEFSKNANLSDAVLRAIADNKNHVKSYTVKVHLVMNPKTPIDVSLKWLPHLRVGELRKIAKSKNLPQVIATAARKRVEDMEQ